MTDYKLKIEELVEQAQALDYGTTKVTLLEEAVRLADTHGDIEQGFWTRKQFVRAATNSGYPETALVAFSWCLSQSDKDPKRFPEKELLWEYKAITFHLLDYPHISRQQINDTLEDIARRFQRSGLSLKAVYRLRADAAKMMGDREAAIAYHQKWQSLPSDPYSECPACVVSNQVEFLIYLGKYEQALAEVEPLLNRKLTCRMLPGRVLAKLLLPLVRLGRLQEANRYHQWGYRLVARNRRSLYSIAQHLLFLVLTVNLSKAAKLFERHLVWALEIADIDSRFYFYRASALLMTTLQEQGEQIIKLRLAKSFPEYRKNGNYDVSFLAKWLMREASEIAARFDQRNGNDYFSNQLAELQELKNLMVSLG